MIPFKGTPTNSSLTLTTAIDHATTILFFSRLFRFRFVLFISVDSHFRYFVIATRPGISMIADNLCILFVSVRCIRIDAAPSSLKTEHFHTNELDVAFLRLHVARFSASDM